MDQSKQRRGVEHWAATCRRDVVEAMLHNGVREVFDAGYLSSMLRTHFNEDDLVLLRAASPHVAELAAEEPAQPLVAGLAPGETADPDVGELAPPVTADVSTGAADLMASEASRPDGGRAGYGAKSYWTKLRGRWLKSIKKRLRRRPIDDPPSR
jgi:hypothetical protein